MSKKPVIILLSGWKRSGKDTAADILTKEFGFKRLGFADPLKDLVSDLFGIKRHAMDAAELKEQPIMYMPVDPKDSFSYNVTQFMSKEFKVEEPPHPVTPLKKYWTPRALCILVGSTMRSVNPNFWVEKALAQVQPGGLYVIADCRYKNEIDIVKRVDAQVVTVRIERFDTSPSDDPSERDLDNYLFDKVINNRHSIEEFQKIIRSLALCGL